MVEDVLTRPGALAGDDVDDAVRQDAFQEVHQFQDAEGRRARWLEDDRTAGGQGRCQFPGGHEEGKFHGMIWPTTPIGSWMTRLSVWSSRVDARPSSLRTTPAK